MASALDFLRPQVRDALLQAGFTTPSEILMLPATELAQRLGYNNVQSIIDQVSEGISPEPQRLDVAWDEDETDCISTGDPSLDDALGGGIRTGAVWEIAGESSAGKTQLALQLSLMATLSPDGELNRSACYVTAGSALRTDRLVEILQNHPVLKPYSVETGPTLSNIIGKQVNNSRELIYTLSTTLPQLLEQHLEQERPVRLLVLDALTPLVPSTEGRSVTSASLTSRSQTLFEVAALLRTLATTYNIAVVVLNNVMDVFDKSLAGQKEPDLAYRAQAEWFARTPLSARGIMKRKETALGIVWANQINARIMLNRTTSTVELDESLQAEERAAKRQKTGSAPPPSQRETTTPLRRLFVLFSAFGPPTSVDYIVTAAGVRVVTVDAPPTQLPAASTSASNPRPTPVLSDEEWALYYPELYLSAGLDSDAPTNQAESVTAGETEREDDAWSEFTVLSQTPVSPTSKKRKSIVTPPSSQGIT